MKFNTLSEWQIRKAQADGQLDNLKGAGKPLPAQEGAGSSASIGFRIMADAGVLPKEIELKKAIDAQRLVLQETTNPADRKRELAVLADLELRHAIEQESRRKFYRTS